jgi:hypothetical protein
MSKLLPVDPKPRPNRQRYLEVLRRMTPQERLQIAFDLTEQTRELMRIGLRDRFPEMSEEELHKLYLERLEKCHNRNY